jgi:hypothetical protein
LEQSLQVLVKIAYLAITALKPVLPSLMDFATLVISAQSKQEVQPLTTMESQEPFAQPEVIVTWDLDLLLTALQEHTVTLLALNLNSIVRLVMLESIVWELVNLSLMAIVSLVTTVLFNQRVCTNTPLFPDTTVKPVLIDKNHALLEPTIL